MMKKRDNKVLYSVITAIVIVVIFAFVFGLLFSKGKDDIYITLYSPIGNTKQVIKTSSGSEIDNKLEPVNIEGYEFIGWFYDDDLTLKVEKGTVFNSSRVLKAGYSKVIIKTQEKDINYNEISNQKFLTIKTLEGTKVTNSEIKTILQKGVKYLDLSNADFEKTIINNEIFFGETTIKEVILPRNAIEIENNAFKNCYNLKYVKLSEETKILGNNAFYNCKSLEEVDNLEFVEVLKQSVFEGCDNLKELRFGKNLKSIESKAFYGLSLNNITIENENPFYRISGNVLYTNNFETLIYAPTNYSGTLVINNNTKKVCDYALYGTKFLTGVYFPASITYIGDSSFRDCKNLEIVNFKSANSYKILNNAFTGCEKIKQIQFGIGLESIGKEAFKDCKSIKNIVFNISTASNISSINSIGNSAFKNCKNLEYINLPDSVMYVGDELFSGCSNLEEVKLSARIDVITEKMFYENKSLLKIETLSNIKKISNYAFAECENLINIESLYSAEELGVGAFKNCINLKTAMFNNVKTIKDICFLNCNELTNISFNNLIDIGSRAFKSCKSITSFYISTNVEDIENDSFDYCESIEYFSCSGSNYFISVDGVLYNKDKTYIMAYPQNKKYINFTIGSDIEEIKDKGLYLNPYLLNINVDNNNTSFSSENGILFNYDKTKLLRYPCGKTEKNVNINYNIQTIAKYAFAFNRYIETLAIPSSVTLIEEYALYGLNNLSSLTIPFVGKTINEDKYIGYLFGANSYVANHNYTPQSLKNIVVTNDLLVAEYSFYDATSLEYIEFNKDVYSIEKFAFYGASSLTEIYFNGAINSIKTNSIYKLPKLKKLTFGFDSLLSIDTDAIGELNYNLQVYIHNKNQNVSQSFRSILISKFSSIYGKAGDWQWQFKNNVKNIL